MAGKNKFESRQYEDFKILNAGGKTVGKIRIKPNRIMWSPPNKQSWVGVSLEQFAAFAMEHGTKQDK